MSKLKYYFGKIDFKNQTKKSYSNTLFINNKLNRTTISQINLRKSYNSIYNLHEKYFSLNNFSEKDKLIISTKKYDNQRGKTFIIEDGLTESSENSIDTIRIYSLWNDFVVYNLFNFEIGLLNNDLKELGNILIPNIHEDLTLNKYDENEIKNKINLLDNKSNLTPLKIKDTGFNEVLTEFLTQLKKYNLNSNSNKVNSIILCPEEYNFRFITKARKIEIKNLESTKLSCDKELFIKSSFKEVLNSNTSFFEFECKKIQVNLFKFISEYQTKFNVLTYMEVADMNVDNQSIMLMNIKRLLVSKNLNFNLNSGNINISSLYADSVNIKSKYCDFILGHIQTKTISIHSEGDEFIVSSLETERGNIVFYGKKLDIYLKKLKSKLNIFINLELIEDFKLSIDREYQDLLNLNYIDATGQWSIDKNYFNQILDGKIAISNENKDLKDKLELNIYYTKGKLSNDQIKEKINLLNHKYIDFFDKLRSKYGVKEIGNSRNRI